MKKRFNGLVYVVALFSILFCSCAKDENSTAYYPAFGTYTSGDFHQHSKFTDGSYTIGYVMGKNNENGLDWWVNSEHGGAFNTDGRTSGVDINATTYWDQENGVTIAGTASTSGGHQNMWRWQSLADYSFPFVLASRSTYPGKVIIQGYEWNVPGHEHCSMGVIDGQFGSNPNCSALAEFEYKFDNNDADILGGAAKGWVKSTKTGHEKAVEAITWLQTKYPSTSWAVPAHPERKKMYTIAAFRDLNNAGPDVCFGFESIPGHQKSVDRGEYSAALSDGGGTFGGCGTYAATVGGLWDAMLSEGRRFWLFANSDFHSPTNDFYPGEYHKTFVSVTKTGDAQAIVDGLRSGNSYIVNGGLISDLKYSIGDATMGQTFKTNKNVVPITITLKSSTLDHIDIIAGQVGSKISPSDASYNVPSVSTTKVIARFDATGGITDGNGIVSRAWTKVGNVITINLEVAATGSMYFRLRGTNWGVNTAGETDSKGNPLADEHNNTAAKALADLWFYTNPVYVKVN